MNSKYGEYVEASRQRRKILASLSGRPEQVRTFEYDRLNLSEYANSLLNIIRNSSSIPRSNENRSYVIGLDAAWGSGKTTFASMLYFALEKREALNGSILPVYYNAWQGDFWNNAFEPFFDCIWHCVPRWCEALKLYDLAQKWNISLTEREEASVDKALERDGQSVENIGKYGLKASAWMIAAYLANTATSGMDSEFRKKMDKQLGKVYEEVMRQENDTEDFFPEYTAFRDAIKSLQEFLEELTCNNRKLVIFIDELDRCRPDFAVQTLEIIKHMFDVENVVFVIALDIDQLSNTVRNVYGDGFDSVGYLERFFNLMTMLPMGSRINYESILDMVQAEIIECEQKKWRPEQEDFTQAYERFRWDSIKTIFSGIAMGFGLSLREYRRVLLNMHILETNVLESYLEYDVARVMYFYCLVLKYKYPLEFSKAVFKYDISGLKDVFTNKVHGMEHFWEEKLSDCSFEGGWIGVIQDAFLKGANTKISSLELTAYLRENQTWSYRERVTQWEYQADERICYSFVLYYLDVQKLETIKDFTLLEYLYRQLEMFSI